jgi:hypothetical protein
LDTAAIDFQNRKALELGDFNTGPFDYKIKKNETGIKAVLNRQGSVVLGEKPCPLSMEKVLGLEKDLPSLPFVYQLSNHSLTQYSFAVAFEFTFSLPGILDNTAFFLHKKDRQKDLGKTLISFSDVNQWHLVDPACGISIHCTFQRPMDVWCFPSCLAATEKNDTSACHSVTLVMTSKVLLEGSSLWACMGKLQFKRAALSRKNIDEI